MPWAFRPCAGRRAAARSVEVSVDTVAFETGAPVGLYSPSTRALSIGAVYAMGYNCVTAQLINQQTGQFQGSFTDAWNRCVGQPLF